MSATTTPENPESIPAVCPVSASGAPPSGGVNDLIPGPEPMPLIGWRGNVARYFRDPIGYMQNARDRFGDIACLAKGGNAPLIMRSLPHRSSTVFALGPECNREILTQPELFERDLVRVPKECPWLADNMSSANGEDRVRQRRVITPAFTAEHLKAYYPDVVRLTDEMLEGWRPGQELDLTVEIEELAAAIASKTLYGQDLKQDRQTLAAIAREVGLALFSPVAKIPINLPGSPYRKFLQLTKRAGASVLQEVAQRRRREAFGDDVLSMMLEAIEEGNVELNEDQLVGNAFTLFLAGHDVPANAISLTLFLLMQHPQVAADLLDEIEPLAGDAPAYDQVFRLPLLDSVVRESLRVLSPAVLIWRRTHQPATLGGFELPSGTEILVSPYLTHVDPAVFPQPKAFRPERWQGPKPSPFEYLPFSYGARKCLGAAFAEIMLRIVIPMIVQRFRLEMPPKCRIDLQVTFTMKPKALPVVVREQDRRFDRSKGEVSGGIRELVDLA